MDAHVRSELTALRGGVVTAGVCAFEHVTCQSENQHHSERKAVTPERCLFLLEFVRIIFCLFSFGLLC